MQIKGIIFRLAVETIGGRNPLKVRRFLANGTHLKHFALERLILTNYDNKIGLTYCAGQDYPTELQDLRKYIYKLKIAKIEIEIYIYIIIHNYNTRMIYVMYVKFQLKLMHVLK